MKPLLPLLILCLWILGCESQNRKKKSEEEPVPEAKIDSVAKEAYEVAVSTESVGETIPSCDCLPLNYNTNYSPELSFQNSERARSKNEKLFSEWSQDSLAKTVTSIGFSGFDTIPNKYAVFRNVEQVSIMSRNGIYGIDNFPKLKAVHFWGSEIDLDTDEKWLSQLEVLTGQKTSFFGLTSFRKTPKLRVIRMGYTGFDRFPHDLEDLACLSELTLGNYRVGEIDLSQMNLSRNPCLKKAEFHILNLG